ncbi:MAG TPA: hypothetical protein VN634_00580 [Candidatus Limnocylindrales bacterium]|nr:hypothetical protein [Candidatus Limnocylindrales bacterium]
MDDRTNTFDKQALVAELRARLAQSLERLRASQNEAQSAAVHPEARQEHSKDMRATEASYVARGLAERVEKLRDDVLAVERMPMRDFDAHEAASSGAIVIVVSDDDVQSTYLLAPAGGGERLVAGRSEVLVLTLQSPLGAALTGVRCGDMITAELPSGRHELEVAGIF